MGGGYYDRDDSYNYNNTNNSSSYNQTTQNSGFEYSTIADQKVGVIEKMHPSLDPKRWKDDQLKSFEANPIVFALDVTGSMGEWSKIIYDKLPMFYGQIMLQKYLKQPSLSFCAIGDVKTDSAPLQVSDFCVAGGIDESICKLYLEGNGGGNNHESYDLAAYFYTQNFQMENYHIPFFFLTCDELFWEECTKFQYNKVFGRQLPPGQQKLETLPYWNMLMDKFNVFVLRKELANKNLEPNVQKKWCELLGEERILKISNPKACIDVILGAICLTSGARNLEEYKADLLDRGQTNERIDEVLKLLTPYWEGIKSGKINVIKNENYKDNKLEDENKGEIFIEIREFFLKKISQENSYFSSNFKDLTKLSQELEGKIPDEIICPITNLIFCEPVKTVEGKIYEKIAIEKWLENNSQDPFSKINLSIGSYKLDYNTIEQVNEFYENSKIYLEI